MLYRILLGDYACFSRFGIVLSYIGGKYRYFLASDVSKSKEY